MSTSTLLIIVSALYLFLDTEIVFKKGSGFRKRAASVLRILLIVAIAFVTKCKEDKDETSKNSEKSERKLSDSLNNAKHTDSIKRYSTKIITLLAERNLWYDSINNSIKKIDTTKGNQEPYIAADPSNTRHIISNDTFYLYPSIKNYGNGVAFSVRYSGYFLSVNKLTGIIMRHAILSSSDNGIDMPINTEIVLATNNFFAPDLYKTTFTHRFYILLIGEYKNSKSVTKKFDICYALSPDNIKWAISTNEVVAEFKKLVLKKRKIE
ncbi:MAG: hypothetical protein V4557_11110 [Bacteroidota bacterium]